MLLAGYGSAILRIADNDTELVRIIGAIVTGRGNFDVCIPIDQFRQEIAKMSQSGDPIVSRLFQFLREVEEFAFTIQGG